MFLSFIVPVYNAEKYLGECLDSLLDQDIPKEEYEIICVNDGSKDGSLAILQAYAEKHRSIVVLDRENGGVATARNAGLDAARGEYIWFVDSDDFVKPNTLSRLQSKILETACDRLIIGAYLFVDTLSEEEAALSRQGKLPVNAPWYDSVVWRCLLRRSFLQEHALFFRYPDLTHGEDGLFMYEVTVAEPKSAQIEEALYFYREHSGSAETSLSVENQKRKMRCYIRIVKILQGYYASGRTDPGTADKLMTFLWFSLFTAAKLPIKDARPALKELKQAGLFPSKQLPECTIDWSYMTSRTDLIGKAFDKVYRNLQTRWGFAAIRALQQLINLKHRLQK